jgi:hypothetical protein
LDEFNGVANIVEREFIRQPRPTQAKTMTRKPYFEIVQKRVASLREGSDKMMRTGTILGKEPPGIEELGDVFQHVYTTIEGENDSSIVRAFEACELDLDNPFHWADLLRALCDLHFSSRRSAKLKLTPAFFETLQQDRAHIRKEYPTQLEQAKRLMTLFPVRYGHYDNANSFRRVFPKQVRKRSG